MIYTIYNGRPVPKEGDIFRHFKGNVYEVVVPMSINCTNNSEDFWLITYKDYVKGIYYSRKFIEFMSKIDREKYPDTYLDKEYRFEFLINKNDRKFTAKYEVDNLLPSIMYNGVKVAYKGFEPYITEDEKVAEYCLNQLFMGIPKPNFILVNNWIEDEALIYYGIGKDNLTYSMPITKDPEIFKR